LPTLAGCNHRRCFSSLQFALVQIGFLPTKRSRTLAGEMISSPLASPARKTPSSSHKTCHSIRATATHSPSSSGVSHHHAALIRPDCRYEDKYFHSPTPGNGQSVFLRP
jgi:hypothetical protein